MAPEAHENEFGFWRDVAAPVAVAATPETATNVTGKDEGEKSAPSETQAAHVSVLPKAGVVTLLPTDNIDRLLLTTKKGRSKLVRPWGMRNVLYSLLGFIGVQVVLAVALLGILLTQLDLGGLVSGSSLTSEQLSKKLTALVTTPVVILLGQLLLYGSWLAFIAFASLRRGNRSFAKDFGLRFRWYDPIAGALIAWGLIALEFLVQYLLQHVLLPNADYRGQDNGAFLTSQQGVWFAIIGIGIGGIVGPFFEELYFRGFIMRGIQRYLGRYAPKWAPVAINTVAVVVSSAIFGIFHFQGSFATLGLTLVVIITGSLGLILALIALKTRRIGMTIFIHAFFNTTTVLLAVLAPHLGS